MRITKNTLLISTLMLVMGAMGPALAADKEATVQIGEDGKLKYIPDEQGNLIPDFSRAGYMGGGVKLPDVPVRKTLTPPEDPDKADDTKRIQDAIDEVGAMPLDKDGFRGAVLLKKGTFRITNTLYIKASGVVLRGEGQKKDGTVLVAGPAQKWKSWYQGWSFLEIQAPCARTIKFTPVDGARRDVADSYVPFGVHSFNLKSTEGLSVGDEVVLVRPSTKEWIKVLGMDDYWKPGQFNLLNERIITDIQGNRVTLDAPVMQPLEAKFGGGWIDKYTIESRISKVGAEHLRFVSEEKEAPEEFKPPREAINMTAVDNSWVRNVSVFGMSHGVALCRGAIFCTLQDIAYMCAPNDMSGGSGYPVQINEGQYCLVQRVVTRGGRHTLSTGAKVQGPNAFLDCVSYGAGAPGGPHQRWATGVLYDNVKGAKIVVGNKNRTGQGWTGAQHVVWNCGGSRVMNPPTAKSYEFKDDFIKKSQPQLPRSLYLKQLEERLGNQAVENITTEAQRKGPVTDLLTDQFLEWDTILKDAEADLKKAQEEVPRAQRGFENAANKGTRQKVGAERNLKRAQSHLAIAKANMAKAKAEMAEAAAEKSKQK